MSWMGFWLFGDATHIISSLIKDRAGQRRGPPHPACTCRLMVDRHARPLISDHPQRVRSINVGIGWHALVAGRHNVDAPATGGDTSSM